MRSIGQHDLYGDLGVGRDASAEELSAATYGGWAFGSPAFRRRIGAASGRRVTPLPRGRPPLAKAKAKAKRRKRR